MPVPTIPRVHSLDDLVRVINDRFTSIGKQLDAIAGANGATTKQGSDIDMQGKSIKNLKTISFKGGSTVAIKQVKYRRQQTDDTTVAGVAAHLNDLELALEKLGLFDKN